MSSLLGPVTDADLRRWQCSRYDRLGELLRLGQDRRLPVLSWTLSDHALIGKATGHANEELRAAFEDWARALGIEWSEYRNETGRIHLKATGEGVVVMADLWEDHPAE